MRFDALQRLISILRPFYNIIIENDTWNVETKMKIEIWKKDSNLTRIRFADGRRRKNDSGIAVYLGRLGDGGKIMSIILKITCVLRKHTHPLLDKEQCTPPWCGQGLHFWCRHLHSRHLSPYTRDWDHICVQGVLKYALSGLFLTWRSLFSWLLMKI